MDQKSEKALCPNTPKEIKIGKTTYLVRAKLCRSNDLVRKAATAYERGTEEGHISQRKGVSPFRYIAFKYMKERFKWNTKTQFISLFQQNGLKNHRKIRIIEIQAVCC